MNIKQYKMIQGEMFLLSGVQGAYGYYCCKLYIACIMLTILEGWNYLQQQPKTIPNQLFVSINY